MFQDADRSVPKLSRWTPQGEMQRKDEKERAWKTWDCVVLPLNATLSCPSAVLDAVRRSAGQSISSERSAWYELQSERNPQRA